MAWEFIYTPLFVPRISGARFCQLAPVAKETMSTLAMISNSSSGTIFAFPSPIEPVIEAVLTVVATPASANYDSGSRQPTAEFEKVSFDYQVING